jgi:hypothetical protein
MSCFIQSTHFGYSLKAVSLLTFFRMVLETSTVGFKNNPSRRSAVIYKEGKETNGANA